MGFSFGPSGLGVFVVIIVLAAVGGRLLGIRLRWWRALVAGFPGLVIGIIVVWAAEGHPRAPRTLPTGAVLFTALIATMLIAVLLELLARPGRLAGVQGRLAGGRVPHPVRSLRARAGRVRRYVQVTRIAGRHGLASYLWAPQPPSQRTGALAEAGEVTGGTGAVVADAGSTRPRPPGRQLARSLRDALEEGGGIFVKLGQVLSTRSDLLSASLERGTLSGNVRLFADERDVRFVASIVNRAVMAFAGAALGITSAVLLGIRGGPALAGGAGPGSGIAVFRLLGYLGLFFGIVLILRVVIAVTREGIGTPSRMGPADRA